MGPTPAAASLQQARLVVAGLMREAALCGRRMITAAAPTGAYGGGGLQMLQRGGRGKHRSSRLGQAIL